MMDSIHPARQAFTLEIKDLEHDVLQMGMRAEAMVGLAVEALTNLDTELAMRVLAADDEVDRQDVDIENHCLKLLVLQQPLASDFRTIGTIIKVITDIERVGDLAVDIAKIAMKVERLHGTTSYVDIPRMANLARAMFREALDAFVRRDMDLVLKVCAQDDEVDELYRDLREQIHAYMRSDPDQVVAASWLFLAIHHLERVADHAVNVSERVAYALTGSLEPLAKSHRSDVQG
jgi:phosphate transport system protein